MGYCSSVTRQDGWIFAEFTLVIFASEYHTPSRSINTQKLKKEGNYIDQEHVKFEF